MQGRIKRFENNPHPALPHHFEYFVKAQPAERGSVVRWLQKTKINIRSMSRGSPVRQACLGNVLVPQVSLDLGPPARPAGELVQPVAAG
jgi:hypothetical protein